MMIEKKALKCVNLLLLLLSDFVVVLIYEQDQVIQRKRCFLFGINGETYKESCCVMTCVSRLAHGEGLMPTYYSKCQDD